MVLYRSELDILDHVLSKQGYTTVFIMDHMFFPDGLKYKELQRLERN